MAIFLVGGPSINDKPAAVFLRSGDIAIMSRASRLSYHAVPRIMKSDIPPSWQTIQADNGALPVDDHQNSASHAKRRKTERNESAAELTRQSAEMALDEHLWTQTTDDAWWQPFDEYVKGCRININVRQVLRSGQTALDDGDEFVTKDSLAGRNVTIS